MEAPSPAQGSPRSNAQETATVCDVPAQCCAAEGEEVFGEARGELQACPERQESYKKPCHYWREQGQQEGPAPPCKILGWRQLFSG